MSPAAAQRGPGERQTETESECEPPALMRAQSGGRYSAGPVGGTGLLLWGPMLEKGWRLLAGAGKVGAPHPPARTPERSA